MALAGLLLGFSLSWMGFADFGQVHRMFTFADLRLLYSFLLGAALTGGGLYLLSRGQPLQPRPIHRGTIAGGVLFGIGWALTGACPGASLVQLGEGQLAALISVGGIVAGTLAYRHAHARWFGWDRGACGDE
jgi:uncharacterized membrane protein YedE/YeeE